MSQYKDGAKEVRDNKKLEQFIRVQNRSDLKCYDY